MTRRDQIHKWFVYALALIPVWLLDEFVLNRIPLFGVIPMLLPLAVVAVAVLEGSVAGAGFGMAVGLLWAQLVEIYDCQHVKVSEYRCPEQISGYEYEVEACWKAIRNGLIEPEEMPHEKTLMVMRMLDGLRSKWGVRFPADDPRA